MNRLMKVGVPILAACALATGLVTSSAARSGVQPDSRLVTWADVPQPTVTPQTDEQDQYNQQHGRPLPAKELLQPTLDSGLTDYRPLQDRNRLHGTYDCGASDVLAALSKRWVNQFEHIYPNVKINLNPPYAGSLGALDLIDGKRDCVFVSRELKPTDISSFRAKFGYDPASIPISGGSYRHFGFLDSMGFVVNKSNPLSQVSLDQLDSLLSTTRLRGGHPIRTWGDLGLHGGWADKPVHIYGLKPWNGFEEFVRQRVLNHNGQRGEWRPAADSGLPGADRDVSWDETVFDQAKHVKEDRYGIAYTGMAYVDQPVRLLALSDHAGAPVYAPTYENVASAKYPLSRLVYLNVNKAPGHALDPVLRELVRFLISKQGQQQVSKQGVFIPLTGTQSTAASRQFAALP